MFNITIIIDFDLIVEQICNIVETYIRSKTKIKAIRLLCSYGSLSENSIRDICEMLK